MRRLFPFQQKREAGNLSEWLRIATGELEPSAQGRVSEEITAHFSDAFEEQVAEGKSESVALRSALANLGDPYCAARKLRKRHLTKCELKWIEKGNMQLCDQEWLIVAFS